MTLWRVSPIVGRHDAGDFSAEQVVVTMLGRHPQNEYRIRGSTLAKPVLLYAVVWIGVLLLFSLGLSRFMSEPNGELIILVSSNVLVSTLVFWGFMRWRRRSSAADLKVAGVVPRGDIEVMRHFTDLLTRIWLIGSSIVVLFSGGLPLLWLISGDESRGYQDFGIATVSGLIAACGMFSAIAVFLDYLLTGSRRRLWVIVAVLLFQVVTINRGGLIWITVEMLAVYLLTRNITVGRAARVAAVIMVMIVLFGVIGDMRVGEDGGMTVTATMSDRGREFFSFLPSGFYWIYLYACAGMTNVNAALPGLEPTGSPYWSTVGLLPTVVRGMIYDFGTLDYASRYPLDMVTPMFNVFTLYGGILADFGMATCVLWTALIALVAAYFYRYAQQGQLWAVLASAVMFQVIMLSIYWDNFTSWVVLFQLVLAFVMRGRIRRSRLWRSEAPLNVSIQTENPR